MQNMAMFQMIIDSVSENRDSFTKVRSKFYSIRNHCQIFFVSHFTVHCIVLKENKSQELKKIVVGTYLTKVPFKNCCKF